MVRNTKLTATIEEAGHETAARGPDRDHDLVGHLAHPADDHRQVPLARREGRRGALSNRYSIPRVRVLRARKLPYFMMIAAVTGLGAARHAQFVGLYRNYLPLMVAWTLVFAMALVQWTLAIFDRPYTASSSNLDRLKVDVSVRGYNEDPATLDLVLFALAEQAKLPDVIHVVDDGSTVDDEKIRDHWQAD